MSRNLRLEAKMHQYFSAWAADHAERYDAISVEAYDPTKHPEQRIDVAKTPAMINRPLGDPSVLQFLGVVKRRKARDEGKDVSEIADEDVIEEYPSEVLREFDFRYTQLIGSWEKAREFKQAFRSATQDGGISIAEATLDLLDNGEAIGVVMDHAEDLFDFAKILGGLSLAIAQTEKYRYLGYFSGWVSKLMTDERIGEEYMPDQIAWGSNARWTIPDTYNAEKYIPDQEIPRAVNFGAVRTFLEDSRRTGCVEVFVPSGSAMQKSQDKKGNPILESPPIPDVSANLLTRLNVLFPCNTWGGRIAVGQAIKVADYQHDAAKLAEVTREALRSQTQELSGLPVIFQEDI